MKKILSIVCIILISTILLGQGTWIQKASLPEQLGRYATIFFSVNNKGYIGAGEIGASIYSNDLWEFDQVVGTWSQKADFGGGNVYGPTVFTINGLAYVCTGTDINNQFKNYVWVYNQQNNTWTQKNNFPGLARYGAFSFSIGTKGYVGMGQNAVSINDFWEYNSVTDTWIERTNFASQSRYGAIAFSINGKGYAGLGSGQANHVNYKDLYEYDPNSYTWTQKANFPGVARNNPAHFVINDEAYVGTGNPTINYDPFPVYTTDFYKYTPSSNQWTQVSSFAGSARTCAACYTIDNKGYIGIGLSGYPCSYLNDFWEYSPSGTNVNEDANVAVTDLKIDLANKSISLTIKEKFLPISFKIYNLTGQIITNVIITDTYHIIKINNLSKGTYLYCIKTKDMYLKSDKFIIF